MEEKIVKMTPKKEAAISYQELKAACEQFRTMAQKLSEENSQLKMTLQQVVTDQSLKQIEAVFACMEHKEFFSGDFFERAAKRIEDYLAPVEDTDKEKEA
jgi:hypothetical protein